MTELQRRRLSTRSLEVMLAAAALLWGLVWWLNERVWTALFTTVLGLDLEQRLPGSVHSSCTTP